MKTMPTLIDCVPEKYFKTCAIVGAGGKSTILYHLAEQLSSQGSNVLVTTTTRIFNPVFEGRDNVDLWVGTPESVVPSENCLIKVAGIKEEEGHKKLVGYTSEQVMLIASSNRFDNILIEADGAKRKPIKAPADNEPVIPENVSLVIGVIGLDALGRELNEPNVHRVKEFLEVTGLTEGELISEKVCASLICSSQGLFKNAPSNAAKLLVFNKADTSVRIDQGRKTASLLEKYDGVKPDYIAITSFKTGRFLSL